jgi:hypothetical protein
MKTLFLSMLVASFAFTASAETTVVNPGSEEGMLRQVLTDIASGSEHNFIQANNPVTATQYFQNPEVLTVWSSEWAANKEFDQPDITEENLVGLLVTETIMCSREFNSIEEMSGKTVQIATWGSLPVERFINDLGKTNNINFVIIPYDGSGSTAKGYAGGDADTVFTIESRQSSLVSDEITNCFAYSKNGELDYQFVDAIITLNGDTELTNNFRSKVNDLKTTDEWITVFNGTTVLVEVDLMSIYNNSIELFKE